MVDKHDVINVNIMLGHVFSHLQNCPFIINLIANPRSIVGLSTKLVQN